MIYLSLFSMDMTCRATCRAVDENAKLSSGVMREKRHKVAPKGCVEGEG